MMKRRKQIGIQLVEVLVAMAVGSIIALAITRAYMASYQIQNSQAGTMRLNETVRYAFDLVSREVRLASFSNSWQPGSTAQRYCTGTIGSGLLGKNDVTGTIDPTSADFSGATYTIANKSDVIRVNYAGEDGSAHTSPLLDCHGYEIPASTRVQETLFVAVDPATNEPSLYCDTSNAHANGSPRALPLVTGVESLQILYGVDSNSDGIIDRYVPWNLVGASSDLIMAIKLSIVARSPTETGTASVSTTFNHFGATAYTAAAKTANSDSGATFVGPVDKRIRTLSTLEIGSRNFSYCG